VQVASASFGVVMRKCEIDGCTNQHRARGFCIVHYNNWVRYESGAGKFETKFRAAERERIIGLLEQALANHTKVLELRPTRSDGDVRHTICRSYQEAIDLVRNN
jgi:hypothetical protein